MVIEDKACSFTLNGLQSDNISLCCGVPHCARLLQKGSDQGFVSKLFRLYRAHLQVPT